MRNLFAVPWLTLSYRTVVTILAAVISVFSIFGLLKINSGIKTPAKEMLTGSIQRSHGVLKPASSDPMAAFIAPASTHSSPQPVQSKMMDRSAVPLPRPRPKRI